MNKDQCLILSKFIGALANVRRVRILCTLTNGELRVGEIAEAVDLPPAHVSPHLRILYDLGYVDRRREWKNVFYSLHDPRIWEMLQMAVSVCADVSQDNEDTRRGG